MSRFEYLSVLISIVIAFGLSEIVTGWGRLLRHRGRVRTYWVHSGFSVLLLLLLIQYWWGIWSYRLVEDWSFFGLIALVSSSLTLALISFVLFPAVDGDRDLDLRAYYYGHARLVFGLVAATLLLMALADAGVGGQPFWHPENAVRGAGLVLAASLAAWRDPRLHGSLLAVAYGLFVVFLAVAWQAD